MNCNLLLVVSFFAAVCTAHYFAVYRSQPCSGDVIVTVPIGGGCRAADRPGASTDYSAGVSTTCASYCSSPYDRGQFKCGACLGLGDDAAKYYGFMSHGYTKYDCNDTAMRRQMCSDSDCTNCTAAQQPTYTLHSGLAACPASPSGTDLYRFPCRYIASIEYNISGCSGPVSQVVDAYTCDVCMGSTKVVCDQDAPTTATASSSRPRTTGTLPTTSTSQRTTTGTLPTTASTTRTTTTRATTGTLPTTASTTRTTTTRATTGTLPTTASPPTTTTLSPVPPATTLPSSVSVATPGWLTLLLLLSLWLSVSL